MSKSGLAKADEDLWLRAEDIYQRYKREEFDIDPVKGDMPMQSWRTKDEKTFFGGTKTKKEYENHTLTDYWMHAIGDWEIDRGNPYAWKGTAHNLSEVFGYVRTYALVPGRSLKSQLDQKDATITRLTSEEEELKEKMTQVEKRFDDCRETTIRQEREISDLKQRLDDIRKEDMMRSLGRGTGSQSTITPDGDEEKDE